MRKYRGEWEPMAAALDAVKAHSLEHGFPHWQAAARFMRGWLTGREGDPAVGIEEMRSGLEAYAGTGSAVLRGYYLGLMAEAHGRAGETGEALRCLDQALAFVAATGERFYEAELYRLKAEVLGSNGAPDVEAIEACLADAVATARTAGIKALELRALTALVRARRDHGRCADALDDLREVYGSFTEGFGTADLREARALIEALA
jgi:adenylate cyclase